MSASRLLILLAALVVVLYVVSLALSSRTGDDKVDPKESWLSALVPSSEFDLSEISDGQNWQNGRWTFASGVSAGKLTIGESDRSIRKVKISLTGSGTFAVEFTPAPSKAKPGEYADARAAPLKVTRFRAGDAPIDLTILEHGGELVARRSPATGTAVFRLE